MATVRLGVLGCADIAVRRMIPAVVRSPFVLAAVASRSRDRAVGVAARFGCDAVEGYDQLLARPDVDAVYVPLPNSTHAMWVSRALEAGKHVLIEKPAILDAHVAAELVASADERGLAVMENFAFLQHPQHDLAQSIIANGELGELRSFNGTFGVPPTDPAGIRYQAELGGGALSEVGCYPIRAAQHYLESPIQVVGASLDLDHSLGVDVAGAAYLRGANGVVGLCGFGMVHSYRSTYDVWGSGGRLVLDWAFTPAREARPVLRLQQQDRETRFTASAFDQFGGVMNAFFAAITDPGLRLAHHRELVKQAELLARIRAQAKRF